MLVRWYDFVKWMLERVDSFPKNQRFIFGQRLADRSIDSQAIDWPLRLSQVFA